MGQLWPKNGTKWDVHLELIKTQGYLCDIHIKKNGHAHVWHSHKEKLDSSTQKNRQKGVAVHTTQE